MENQTRFDLNAAVENWRNELAAQPNLASDDRRELETHLRDLISEFQRKGLNDEESFWLARRRIGKPPQLGDEFVKANPAKVLREIGFWMIAGMIIYSLASDLLNVVLVVIALTTRHFAANGFSLGWLGVAGEVFMIALAGIYFSSFVSGRFNQISVSITRIFQKRMLMLLTILVMSAVLKITSNGFTAILARELSPYALGQFFMVAGYSKMIGPFIILMLLAIVFLRLLKSRSFRIKTVLLFFIISTFIFSGYSQNQQPPLIENKGATENQTPLEKCIALSKIADKKKDAVQMFLHLDFKQRPLFSSGSVLNFSETQFAALPESARESLSQQMIADIDSLKKICSYVKDAGQDAVSKNDQTEAKKFFNQLKVCGEALDRPDSLALLQLVGKSLEKLAAKNLAAIQQ